MTAAPKYMNEVSENFSLVFEPKNNETAKPFQKLQPFLKYGSLYYSKLDVGITK